jgi:hypothetical protein
MLYICGDSYGIADPDSNIKPWHSDLNAINLCKNCASNLYIGKQVDTAIQNEASFIIILFTSIMRQEWKGTFFTFNAIENSPAKFSDAQIATLKSYYVDFFELDNEIYKNQCIIESTLQKLVDSNIPFLFDQGGFDHPKHGATKKYFSNYDQYRSKYCLWDYGDTVDKSPAFHITDQNIHNQLADYYAKHCTSIERI